MLAEEIKKALDESIPKLLRPGNWHLPFVTDEDFKRVDHFINTTPEFTFFPSRLAIPVQLQVLIKASAARCARTSYLTHEGKDPDIASDVRLHDDLVYLSPVHASPTEHQASPDRLQVEPSFADGTWQRHWTHRSQHGNLKGWRQYRRMIPGERVREDNDD